MDVECSLRARGEVAVLRAPLSLLATPCCPVPLDSSYAILVFSPRTPTVTRAGRRREGQEGSGIAHCGHRVKARQKFALWRVRQVLLRSRPQLLSATPVRLAILRALAVAAMVPQCSTYHPMITLAGSHRVSVPNCRRH